MCPFTASLDIDVGSTDEQLVQYLVGRRLGDPIPSNVITEVSPFHIEPWNSPENMWYLYNPEDMRSDIREKGIKVTREGYWQLMVQDQEILSGDTTGRKTVRRFYKGKAPLGDETNWFMHEYQAEPIPAQVLCHKQDFNSLCRVFLENNGILDCEGNSNAGAFDDVDGDNVEAMLLQFLGGEESGCGSLESTTNSEEVCGSEQRQLKTTATSPCPLVSDRSDALDDYMELNDLYSIATSSSCSDNSSIPSLESDEYFDADALITDLQNTNNARNTDDGRIRLSSNVKAPAKSDEIVTRPPAQGSIHHISNNNMIAEEGVLSSADSGNGAVLVPQFLISSAKASQDASISRTSPVSQPKPTLSGSSKGCGSNTRICENASSSKPSKENAPKRTHSGSSEGSGSSRGSGSRPSRRVSSLKKRYCCFGYPEADS